MNIICGTWDDYMVWAQAEFRFVRWKRKHKRSRINKKWQKKYGAIFSYHPIEAKDRRVDMGTRGDNAKLTARSPAGKNP
jgi:hypothetical protein